MADGDPGATGRRRDAALAAAPLAFAVGAVVLDVVRLGPVGVAVGAALAVVLEWLAHRHRQTVSALWERRMVQAGATAGTLLAIAGIVVGLGGSAAGSWAISVAVGAFGTYLLVLGVAAAGPVDPGGDAG